MCKINTRKIITSIFTVVVMMFGTILNIIPLQTVSATAQITNLKATTGNEQVNTNMSTPKTLTVRDATYTPVEPTITTQPVSASKNVGESVTFVVAASSNDSGSITYQWQKSVDGTSWIDIANATSTSYTIQSVTAADDNSKYKCIVTNSKYGTSIKKETEIATLIVNTPAPAAVPVITVQPVSISKTLWEAATFTVGASSIDSGILTYQWQKSYDGTTWINITGATNATYINSFLVAGDNGSRYRCVVTNNKNGLTATATTNPAILTISSTALVPLINIQPFSISKYTWETATFAVGAVSQDGGIITYQWQKSIDNGITWTYILGGTDATYTMPSPLLASDDGSRYRCIVTDNKNGLSSSALTNTATLSINLTSIVPLITVQPLSVTKNAGDAATFSIAAASQDSGILSYKWQKSTDGINWADIIGATNTSYTTSILSTSDNKSQYRCVVTDNKNGVMINSISNAVTLTVEQPVAAPIINVQPVYVARNVGETAIFALVASNTDNGVLTYQWQKSTDGVTWANLAGATDTSYTTPKLIANDNGSYYRCVVTNTRNGMSVYTITNTVILTVKQSSTTPTNQSTPTQNLDVDVVINGKVQKAATAVTSKISGRTATTLTLDDTMIESTLNSLGKKATVLIQTPANVASSDMIISTLKMQTLKDMVQKDSSLKIQTNDVTYTIPASQINFNNILKQMGNNVNIKDIKLNISIAKSSDSTAKTVENTAKKNNCQVIENPFEFEITATNGSKSVEVNQFNGYVERLVVLPAGFNPSKLTTAVVINKDGSFSHIPTTITLIYGKYYAKINSLTNSTYAIVSAEKTFSDIQNNWAKSAVNDMASRFVIAGAGNNKFQPNSDITRAEFASIVVSGLGLMRTGTGKVSYNDVNKKDWYFDAVSIANDYGLIKGTETGKFDPSRKITREEAMAIINRAMVITNLKTNLTDSQVEQSLIKFEDNEYISSWAKKDVAACIYNNIIGGNNGSISPKKYITRAEVAAIVQRLLVKSNLINAYTGK